MKKTIWKYEIENKSEILIPKNSEFLKLDMQDGRYVAWFIVNTEGEMELKKFRVLMTGEIFEEFRGRYLGTLQFRVFGSSIEIVAHVFEDLS